MGPPIGSGTRRGNAYTLATTEDASRDCMKSPIEFRYAAETSEAVRQQQDNVHWTNHNSLSFFLEVTDIPEKFEGANN